MATITSLKKVSAAITGIAVAVSNTFVESAGVIASTCHAAFGGSLDIADADIKAIQDGVADNASWKGSSSEGARRSEVKAIVQAYPWLESACKTFKAQYGELRREHFVKIAREIPQCPDATTAAMYAVEFYQTRDSSKGGAAKTQQEKLVAALKQALKNTRGSKMQNDLLAFCNKNVKSAVK